MPVIWTREEQAWLILLIRGDGCRISFCGYFLLDGREETTHYTEQCLLSLYFHCRRGAREAQALKKFEKICDI